MAVDANALLVRAQEAQRASKRVAFRSPFDPDEEADWIELVRDLAALANSGGGVVVFDATKPGLDRAAVRRALSRYARTDFDWFDVREASRNGRAVSVLLVDAVDEAPIVFTEEGRYIDERHREHVAFTPGSVYFRHGGSSRPATNDDLRTFVDRRLRSLRRRWFGDIRRVMTEAEEAHVAVRITDDPDAPVYGQIDTDQSHPYRQKEVIREVNTRLPEGLNVNAFDVLSVRRVHGIDEESHPDFFATAKAKYIAMRRRRGERD